MMLNKFGELFGFGRNEFGQLGDGTNTNRETVVPIINENFKIIDVSAGGYHSLILKSNGAAYSFGYNDKGQLGIGNTNNKNTPNLLSKKNIITISAGERSSFILEANYICFTKAATDPQVCSANGICVYQDQCSCALGYYGYECQYKNCFGKNSSDPTVCSGHGNCTDVDVCTCSSGFNGKECELNQNFDTQTIVYTTGFNNQGQLGTDSTTDQSTFTQLPTENYFVLKVFAANSNTFLTRNYSSPMGIGQNSVRIVDSLFNFFRIINLMMELIQIEEYQLHFSN